MTLFHSSVNPASDEFKRNRADMLASIETMREILDRAAILSDKALPKFQKRNQLLPRERLSRPWHALSGNPQHGGFHGGRPEPGNGGAGL